MNDILSTLAQVLGYGVPIPLVAIITVSAMIAEAPVCLILGYVVGKWRAQRGDDTETQRTFPSRAGSLSTAPMLMYDLPDTTETPKAGRRHG